jgi:hypothetical protein
MWVKDRAFAGGFTRRFDNWLAGGFGGEEGKNVSIFFAILSSR